MNVMNAKHLFAKSKINLLLGLQQCFLQSLVKVASLWELVAGGLHAVAHQLGGSLQTANIPKQAEEVVLRLYLLERFSLPYLNTCEVVPLNLNRLFSLCKISLRKLITC